MKGKKALIWAHMKEKGNITTAEAFYKYHYSFLPRYIKIWRASGIEIADKWEFNDHDRWKRYMITRAEAERAEKEGLVI